MRQNLHADRPDLAYSNESRGVQSVRAMIDMKTKFSVTKFRGRCVSVKWLCAPLVVTAGEVRKDVFCRVRIVALVVFGGYRTSGRGEGEIEETRGICLLWPNKPKAKITIVTLRKPHLNFSRALLPRR